MSALASSRLIAESLKGHDVLTCERQQRGFSLNVSAHFAEPVSSDVADVVVSGYGEASM